MTRRGNPQTAMPLDDAFALAKQAGAPVAARCDDCAAPLPTGRLCEACRRVRAEAAGQTTLLDHKGE